MKKYLVLLVIISFFAVSCSGDEQGKMERKGFKKATVINMDIDGCEYVLQLESGEKVEPVNLSDEFKADGLEIWVKYEVDEDKMGSCMMGHIVNIEEIIVR